MENMHNDVKCKRLKCYSGVILKGETRSGAHYQKLEGGHPKGFEG